MIKTIHAPWIYRTRRLIGRTVTLLLLLLLLVAGSIVMLAPFVWMFLSSFKTNAEITATPLTWLPSKLLWRNYVEALQTFDFPRALFNSLLVAGTLTVAGAFTSALAGYILAKYRFPGRDVIFTLIIALMLVPFEVLMVPLSRVVVSLRLSNTYWGLLFFGPVNPFGIFLLRQFMLGLPDELIDAARLDGASQLGIFGLIVLPLVRPALAAFSILQFVWSWDNFVWPLIVVDARHMETLPLALKSFSTMHGVQYSQLFAASVLVVLPLLLVFLVFSKQIIQGIALTGLKG